MTNNKEEIYKTEKFIRFPPFAEKKETVFAFILVIEYEIKA